MKQGYLSYLVELLNSSTLYGVAKEIDIAKGMYKLDGSTKRKYRQWRSPKQ
jgi:hypothetical protein